MAVDGTASATLTRDFLVTNKILGHAKKRVVAVGDGLLAKTPVEIVPGEQLIRVLPNKATFIGSLAATPIQNLSNFSRGLKRFQVGRAPLGIKNVEFCALGKTGVDVRARVQLATTLRTPKLNTVDDKQLKPKDAFECFMNLDAATAFTLPNASPQNVGLEYYFAVNPAEAAGTLTIQRKRERDAIQMRNAQQVENGIVTTTQVVLLKKIVGTQANVPTTTDNIPISVVVACRAPGLWVVENAAAEVSDLGDGVVQSVSRWTFTVPDDVVEE